MPNIDLYIPDTKKFQSLREQLEYHNNKDTLQEVAEIFLWWANSGTPNTRRMGGYVHQYFQAVL